MIRTQIQLTPEQSAALHRLARERGVSVAALLREAADLFLGSPPSTAKQRALRAVGAYASGHSDVSREHDAHLVDAFR